MNMVEISKHTGEEKFFALLSYLGVFPLFPIPLFLIPLLIKKDHIWIHRHAKQGFFVFLAIALLGWIPLIGWIIAIFYMILSVVEMIKILQDKPYWKMPFIGDIAEKVKI